MTDPTPLSPAANAVLTAVTLTRYDVPPEGLPAFAEEMAPLLAAALRALARHQHPAWDGTGPACHWAPAPHTRRELLNLAAELEGAS